MHIYMCKATFLMYTPQMRLESFKTVNFQYRTFLTATLLPLFRSAIPILYYKAYKRKFGYERE